MKVENIIVYRIVTFDTDVKERDLICPSKRETKGEYKIQIEERLEAKRPKEYPSRDKCLYVCFSKENAYEWAYIMYGRRDTPYKLLTLEATGELYWFMSDCYNFLGDKFTQEQLDKACKEYWNSMTESKSDLILDKGYEGLFVGDAVVKGIEYKNYVNGESFDVV